VQYGGRVGFGVRKRYSNPSKIDKKILHPDLCVAKRVTEEKTKGTRISRNLEQKLGLVAQLV
jgi:hypothetical protein